MAAWFLSMNSRRGEQRLVARLDVAQRQNGEFIRRFLHHHVLVGRVENRRLDVSLQERQRAHLGPGHVADVLKLDAVLLGREQHDRFGARAAPLHGDLLVVEILPALVAFFVYDREKLQRAQLNEKADRHGDFLQRGVRRALTDVGLTVDHGLGRQFFALKRRDLDVHAALLGALDGDQQRQFVDGNNIAQSVANLGSRLRRGLAGESAKESVRIRRLTSDFSIRIIVATSLIMN